MSSSYLCRCASTYCTTGFVFVVHCCIGSDTLCGFDICSICHIWLFHSLLSMAGSFFLARALVVVPGASTCLGVDCHHALSLHMSRLSFFLYILPDPRLRVLSACVLCTLWADLSLSWTHIPHCWKSQVTAQICQWQNKLR